MRRLAITVQRGTERSAISYLSRISQARGTFETTFVEAEAIAYTPRMSGVLLTFDGALVREHFLRDPDVTVGVVDIA